MRDILELMPDADDVYVGKGITVKDVKAEIERLRSRIEELIDENINLENVAKDRYCEMQTEIERLRTIVGSEVLENNND